MSAAGDGTVLVVAKAPEPGRVKTRLCPPCTGRQAARIAEAALADTFSTVAAADPARRVVALDGAEGPWIPSDFEVVQQVRGGLGERLEAAFGWLARTGSLGPMIVLGMDTPQLSVGDIVGALCAIGEPGVDAVLGPAIDGGYWTIGFSAEVVAGCRGLFDEVPMSTSGTADAQLARLEALGLECRLLGCERDIDTWEDAVTIAAQYPDLRTSRVVAGVLADRASPLGPVDR